MPESSSTPGDARRADLVMEGGGVKGIGLCGAVIALTEAGYTFPRVAGTSAGAISAALVAALQAAGRPMAKLKDYVESVDYPRFEQESSLRSHLGVVGDAAHLLLHKGLFSGNYLVEWLGGILEEIGITTFAQLRIDDPGSDLPSECSYSLVVHTADITRGKVVRLPWDYPSYGIDADRVRIVDAVRASMSIPFFFEPISVDVAHEVTHDGVVYAPGRVTWVDGGLLSNFPVEVFDRSDGRPSRWPTIGIKLSADAVSMPPPKPTRSALDEALACLHTVLNNANRYYLPPDKAARTMFVDTTGIASTDFHLTAEQRDTLFANGRAAAEKWLADSTTT